MVGKRSSTMIRINKRLSFFFAIGFLFIPLLLRSQEYNWAKIDEEAFEQNQPTEKIMDVIGIKPGMYVGEVGAGGGRVAVRVARRVRDTGRVFANDISESALAYMRERCVREKIKNMEVIKGTLTDPRFPQGKLNAVYLTFTYRHLDRPVDVLRNIAPALKPGGVLAIIEAKSYNREPAKNEIIINAGLAGYALVKLETFLPEDDIYIFKVKTILPCSEDIHEATKKGNILVLKAILDRNPKLINATAENGI
jgi:ubiquinone/menaquinone biosynthesis C-methylase UbiE